MRSCPVQLHAALMGTLTIFVALRIDYTKLGVQLAPEVLVGRKAPFLQRRIARLTLL